MYQANDCVNCQKIFTPQNAARIIPTCGHNICTHCLKKSIAQKAKILKCSLCQSLTPFQSDQIQVFPKDITILKHIRQTSISMSSSQKKLSQDTEILSGQMLTPEFKNFHIDKCNRHAKLLDIICINDRKLLCPHCAIFGQHRNHKFKTIEEFCKDVEDRRKCLSIIQNKKAKVDQIIGSKQYKANINQQLKKRKGEIYKQIKQKYNYLRQLIFNAQQSTNNELEKAFTRIQFQVKRLSRKEGQTQKLYQAWKQKCQNHFVELDKEEKLIHKIQLFYDNLYKNFKEGQQYVKQLQQKNKSIKQSISSLIKTVSIEHSQSIQNYISHYVRIFEEPTNLTAKSITISREKSPQEKQQRKKPLKVQFVKSEIMQSYQDSVQKKQKQKSGSKSKQNNYRAVNIVNIEPLTKIRHSSRNQKIDRKMLTPQKNLTPMKNLKSSNNGIQKSSQENIEYAQKMLTQFKKSTGTLDLTNCELYDEQFIQIVQGASECKKIKYLKATKNKLTSDGFREIIGFLSNVKNLNLSHNLLNEDALQQIIRKKDKFPQLRIINLTSNKLNERKARTRIDQLKRYGIIVTL